jgi:general stress protein 26
MRFVRLSWMMYVPPRSGIQAKEEALMSERQVLCGDEGKKKIGELIKDVRICMLTTAASDGSFDSRPMATQETDFDGTVYFLTRHESGKVIEIENDAHVSLLYADPSNHNYVAAKGKAQVSRDQAKIHELWNPMFKAWFPEGEDDPNIAVLKVEVDEAQYWEASSSKLVFGLKYLARAVTGGSVDVGEQGKVLV